MVHLHRKLVLDALNLQRAAAARQGQSAAAVGTSTRAAVGVEAATPADRDVLAHALQLTAQVLVVPAGPVLAQNVGQCLLQHRQWAQQLGIRRLRSVRRGQSAPGPVHTRAPPTPHLCEAKVPLLQHEASPDDRTGVAGLRASDGWGGEGRGRGAPLARQLRPDRWPDCAQQGPQRRPHLAVQGGQVHPDGAPPIPAVRLEEPLPPLLRLRRAAELLRR